MMTSVLPLISPEKGVQLGYIAQGLLLVVSGVYYDVGVLPGWMQALARISPATYALRALRGAIIDGAGVGSLWGDIWPLLVIGAIAIPLGWRSSAAASVTPSAREAQALGLRNPDECVRISLHNRARESHAPWIRLSHSSSREAVPARAPAPGDRSSRLWIQEAGAVGRLAALERLAA